MMCLSSAKRSTVHPAPSRQYSAVLLPHHGCAALRSKQIARCTQAASSRKLRLTCVAFREDDAVKPGTSGSPQPLDGRLGSASTSRADGLGVGSGANIRPVPPEATTLPQTENPPLRTDPYVSTESTESAVEEEDQSDIAAPVGNTTAVTVTREVTRSEVPAPGRIVNYQDHGHHMHEHGDVGLEADEASMLSFLIPVPTPDTPLDDVLEVPTLRHVLKPQESPFVGHNNWGGGFVSDLDRVSLNTLRYAVGGTLMAPSSWLSVGVVSRSISDSSLLHSGVNISNLIDASMGHIQVCRAAAGALL